MYLFYTCLNILKVASCSFAWYFFFLNHFRLSKLLTFFFFFFEKSNSLQKMATICKQWRFDQAFCGVKSLSALFANYPFGSL